MTKKYDVIIVGASLAGSSAAIELGKYGLKVALIDKAAFPRRKPCGEGLSCFGLSQLEKLGLKETVLNLPHNTYDGYKIKAGKLSKLIPNPWRAGITIQRSILDNAVLKKALQFPSVEAHLSTNVTALTDGEVQCGVRRLSARKIILASGTNTALLKNLRCRVFRSGPSRSAITATYKGAYINDNNWISIIVKKDYEICCTPLADGFLNVAILTRTSKPLNLRSLYSSKSLLKEIFEECSFSGELALPPQGRSNIGNIRRCIDSESIILAGDVKEEFDPIGGMGMSHALSSGIEAAQLILKEFFATDDKQLSTYSTVDPSSAMRNFTKISYRFLGCAKYFPPILSLGASSVGSTVLKYFTKELA